MVGGDPAEGGPDLRELFDSALGIDLDTIPANDLADPNDLPPAGVFAAYDAMARAIGEFEKLRRFNRFNSKFDFVMAGVTTFSEQEQRGFDLFIGEKAKCSACHVTDLTIAPDGSEFHRS